MTRLLPLHALRLGLLLAVVAAGCSGAATSSEDETTRDLRQISRAYDGILSWKNKPPRAVEEIRNFLADLHKDGQGGKPEDVLTSSRDGQPYVIVLGVDLGAKRSTDIFIYEKNGKDGLRYVMQTSREVRQITDADFKNAAFAKGHKPS